MEGNLECTKPATCLKLNTQQCCLDARCALPCDAEVPCLISALGLTCIKNYECVCKCGEKLGDTAEASDDDDTAAGAPPAPDAAAAATTAADGSDEHALNPVVLASAQSPAPAPEGTVR